MTPKPVPTNGIGKRATPPEPRWTALTAEQRVDTVRAHAAKGMTEDEINAATGAANGAVRVICRRNNISLTSVRDKKARQMAPDGEGVDVDAIRRRIAQRAAQGARKTRIEQFGGTA